MNELHSYIEHELSNIPFNLSALIFNYIELNNQLKIAFVGGFIRDLLIKKFHGDNSYKTVDFDMVIEGSALSFAKFIKKNISNVEVCLIKEFKLYNTVELNINNIKFDIASSRLEKYLAPGFNPIIDDSNIINDLKRRDFSINAIAYEMSQKEIIDPFKGINHIQKKELHLLHEKSISDDPSRILRGAKYSTRFGFNISKDSLEQAKTIIKQWPWKETKTNYGNKFPPGISIRLRMELTEIFKYDCLSAIIKKLDDWEAISILNSDIKVDYKFLRGLRWIKRLKGNLILYIAKDSESIDLLCDRLFINKKDKKVLKDYLLIKNKLKINEKEFYKFSPSTWTNFIEENNLDPDTVKLIISDGGRFWRQFLRWLLIYRFIKSDKTGEKLIQEGWVSGKKLGDELKRLRDIKIDKYINK